MLSSRFVKIGLHSRWWSSVDINCCYFFRYITVFYIDTLKKMVWRGHVMNLGSLSLLIRLFLKVFLLIHTPPFSSPLFCENKNNNHCSDLQRKNLMHFWCFLKVFCWHVASFLFVLISWKKPTVVMLRGNLDLWCLLLSTGVLSGKYTAANPPSGPRGRTFNAAFLAKVINLSLHPLGFFHIAWYF